MKIGVSTLYTVSVILGLTSAGPKPPSPTGATDERFDNRTAVKLSPAASWAQKQKIEAIVEGSSRNDYPFIERAMAVLGTSGAPSSCATPSEPTEGIRYLARHFKCRADGIRTAAQAQDRDAVLQAPARTLSVCNGCHVSYRQQVH